MDAVAVHGFPLDWNHWQINEWPQKIAEIQAIAQLPIWVTAVGASTFGADEIQVFGLQRTAELLLPMVDHVFWYSLLDLPPAWEATTRHGDHQFCGQLQTLRTRLIELVEQAGAVPDNLDLLRTVLIGCGQVEQGAYDTCAKSLSLDEAKPWLDLFHQATAHTAAAFYGLAYRPYGSGVA